MLEEACHELDLVANVQGSRAGVSYERYITALREQGSLRDEEERVGMQVEGMEQLITTLAIALPNADSHPPYIQLCRELGERKERIKRVVSTITAQYALSAGVATHNTCMFACSESRDTEVGRHHEKGIQ